MFVTSVVLLLAAWKYIDMRSSENKDAAHFFDRLQETSNVALLAAQYSIQANANPDLMGPPKFPSGEEIPFFTETAFATTLK